MSDLEKKDEEMHKEAVSENTVIAEDEKKQAEVQDEPESAITEMIPVSGKSKTQEFIEFFRDLIIILVVVLIIRTYLVAPFQISGSSMETSYHDKEFIIVNKFSYASLLGLSVGDPVRGDVVIFRPHASNGKEYYIKRVIGMPGETIRFKDGEVYVKRIGSDKFIKLNEDYLSPVNKGKTFLPFDVKETEFKIPDKEYFLIGDNRNNSSDSRSCFMSCSIAGSSHFIKRSDIVGRVFLDFGYFNIFKKNEYSGEFEGLGKLQWESKPRFLDTPKTWDYKELD